jgi:predicted transposase YdaD
VAKPFDAVTKERLEKNPRAWLEFLLGRELGEVRVVDADLSTITTEADKILVIDQPKPWIVHVEFQSSHDPQLPLRVQRYNILARYRHSLPVQSVVVLLRDIADGIELTGVLEDRLPDGFLYHQFRYNTVKVWDLAVEGILAGDLATLPLAPISRVQVGELPRILRLMDERIERDASHDEKPDLWTATFLLMGLIFPENLAITLLQGKSYMRDSTTYQAILREGEAKGKAAGKAEGKAEEAKNLLLRLGRKHLGSPPGNVEVKIQAMADVEKLEELAERVYDVASWDELFNGS